MINNRATHVIRKKCADPLISEIATSTFEYGIELHKLSDVLECFKVITAMPELDDTLI